MKIINKRFSLYTLCFIVMVLALLASQSMFLPSIQAASVESSDIITVTFDANKGKVNKTSKIVDINSEYGDLPVPTRKYYDFAGWYTFPSGGVKVTKESIVSRGISHTLYARWKGISSEITLNANGGQLSNGTITVYYGSKYRLPKPTKQNFVFEGWYTAAKDGQKIKSNSIFDENSKKTLYARWKEKTLKIKLIAYNGDTFDKEVTCGKKYGKLAEPKKEGYIFGGWYTWDDYNDDEAKQITAENIASENDKTKLFARWYIMN